MTTANGGALSFFSGSPITVLLDSGGTVSRLPPAIVTAIGNSFPTAKYDASIGFYVVDCAQMAAPGSVDFGFGSKIIRVAYKDFIWKAGTNFCVLGLLPETSKLSLL